MRGYCGIGLFNPQFDVNVGSVLRASQCFGANFVASEGGKVKPGQTDTMKGYRHLPYFHNVKLTEMIPFDCVPVAVDLIEGSQCLTTYEHPERAFYIFGPENGTLGKRITDKCRDIVSIPTKGCLNLAMSVNIVLYDRKVKV